MVIKLNIKIIIPAMIMLCIILIMVCSKGNRNHTQVQSRDTIKWMDFNVNLECMKAALKIDIETNANEYPIDWTDAIAYLACVYDNNFSKYSPDDLNNFCRKIQAGKTIEELTENMKYFDYYKSCYEAVLGGFAGDYEIGIQGEDGKIKHTQKYGLKAFSPIAAGYAYNHYDDFGASRSYGYKRKHLGNDIMGSVGTPIVAVESGYIEAIGWNRYGGWRIGIRSHDKKRYYYYAHLKKDHPYADDFELGQNINAGTVIGYMGMTGYSEEENINNIRIPHLHFGMQIIFDESQKDSENEIWIDVFDIVKLLSQNRSETIYDSDTNEHRRKHTYKDPEVKT